MQPMPHRRSCLVAMCGALLIAVTTTGCIGAVDRADFEKVIQARGGGLVSTLPSAAIDSLRQRLATNEIQASVIALTAPASNGLRLSMLDQQPQVSRFLDENHDLAGPDAAAHLRIRVPGRPDQQDDYTFANGTLHGPTPVHVSASDHPDDEMFDIADVSGLLRLEEVLDVAVTRAAVPDGHVTSVVVNRIGPDVVMTVNVTSARTTVVAQFDGAGTFLRKSQV